MAKAERLPDLVTTIIDSILEKPQDWTWGNHTLDHKNGVKIWHANTLVSRRIYAVGDTIREDAIPLSNDEKRLLDRAVLTFKKNLDEKGVSLKLKKDALKRLNDKGLLTYDQRLFAFGVSIFFAIFTLGFLLGAVVIANAIESTKQADPTNVAPISNDSNIAPTTTD